MHSYIINRITFILSDNSDNNLVHIRVEDNGSNRLNNESSKY